MTKIRRKINGGHTLVEVAISLLCAAAFFCGLVRVYAYGIEEFNNAASKLQMLNEGTLALRQIGVNIRNASTLYVIENSDPNRSRLTVTVPDVDNDNNEYGRIEYYTDTGDHTVRIDDRRVGINDMRILCLPKRRMNQSGGRRFPFMVTKMNFQYADDDQDIFNNNGAKYMVKIDMALEDSLGNTVNLTTTQTKMNR
ncbi:MAG: hypothetical protein GY839_19720 [candidate division Zixibacteria bacterium]|nr:hypothetical protein [candidate division Zixibacteria bacterium]